MNPKVDFYFAKEGRWQTAVEKMRTIALDCNLEETLKWGCPCYTFDKKNAVLIHTFKEYCAFLFFKGAILDDPAGILVQPTENVQASRQIRFTDAKQVTKAERILKNYILNAIETEKAGLKVVLKKTTEFNMPEEFEKVLKKKSALKKAFEALTPGRQRGYLLFFSAAKQSATREARIEKSIPQIMAGKGLND